MGPLVTMAASLLGYTPVPYTPVTQAAASSALARPRSTARTGAGTRISSGFVDTLENNHEVKSEKWRGTPWKLGVANTMIRDPHVAQIVNGAVSVLTSGSWRFRPASPAPIDREVADFLSWCFFECLPWHRDLRSIYRGALINGFHIVEPLEGNRAVPVDRFPNHPGKGVGVVPTALRDVPARTIYRWKQKQRDPSKLEAIEQWLPGSDAEASEFKTVRSNRLIRWTWDQEGANFEGLSPLRPAYQPWKLKVALVTINAIDHERTGLGTPMIQLPEGADEIDIAEAETVLAEMRANEKGYLILSNGFEFKWTEGSTGTKDAAEKAIARCNIDIAHTLAQGFMLLSLANKTGSNALSGTQAGQFHLQSEGGARLVADGFNTGADGWSFVERLVRINYGDAVGIPVLECRNLPTRDWLDVAKTYFAGVSSGAIRADGRTEDEIRAMMQIDPYDADTAIANIAGPENNAPYEFASFESDEDEDGEEDNADELEGEEDSADDDLEGVMV